MEAQIEEAIKFRKKANFKILTRLSQIIDQYPYLRFHQILMIYKISELGVDKFNEESVETLKKLEHEMVEKELVRLLVIVLMGTILLVTREVMGFETAVMTGLAKTVNCKRHITDCCNHKITHAYGYIWKYGILPE